MSRPLRAYGRAIRDPRDGSLIYDDRPGVLYRAQCGECELAICGTAPEGAAPRQAAVSVLEIARHSGWSLSIYRGELAVRCPAHRDYRLEHVEACADADDLLAALDG